MQILKKLGLRIRKLRESKGWTLEDVEEHGWPSWTHMQQVETGKKNVNFTTIVRIAKLYKISVSELLKDF